MLQRVSSTFVDISSIRLCTVLLLSGILLRTSCEERCNTERRTSPTAGKIKSLPMVCSFPALAIINEILYDAFNPSSSSFVKRRISSGRWIAFFGDREDAGNTPNPYSSYQRASEKSDLSNLDGFIASLLKVFWHNRHIGILPLFGDAIKPILK